MSDPNLLDLSEDDIKHLISCLPQWTQQWKRQAVEDGKRVGTTDTSEYLYTVAVAASLRTIGLPARVLFHDTKASLVSDEEHLEEQVDACTIELAGQEFGLRGDRGRAKSLERLMEAHYPDYRAGKWTTEPAADGAEDVYGEANPDYIARMVPTLQAWVAERHAARLDGDTLASPKPSFSGKPRF